MEANKNKERTYSYKEMENLAYLSADLLEHLPFDGSRDGVQYLVDKAVKLEKRLGGKDEDEGNYDYFEELLKFENEIKDELYHQFCERNY